MIRVLIRNNNMRKHSIIVLIICMAILLLSSCSKESVIKEGYYYRKSQYLEKTVYGFIQIKNGQYIKDHSLYLDLNRINNFRKPYQPEIYQFEMINGFLIIDDDSHSYEVTKQSFLGKKEIITKPRYKVSSCSGQICLKNADIADDVWIFSD